MDLLDPKKKAASGVVQKNLRMEVNLGAALPVFSRMPKGDEKKNPHRAIVQLSEDDGSLKSLEIETRSELGPLSPRDYSVLVSLIDIAYEKLNSPEKGTVIQGNSYRIYVKYIDVCKKLGLDENSISHVKKSLKKIKSQEMRIKDFLYDATSGTIKRIDEETNLILKMGKYLLGEKESSNTSYYSGIYVDLDSFIVDSMLAENVSVMNRNIFLDLPSGPARRIYSYLASKRTIFGDEFTVKLSEIATLVGKEASYKTKEHLAEQFSKITDASAIQFYVSKDSGVMDWSVFVSFKDYGLLIFKNDSFFHMLTTDYSSDIFELYDLDEILVENYITDVNKKFVNQFGTSETDFRNSKVDVGEFLIDVLMHRIHNGINHPKSFKAYLSAMADSLIADTFELPDRYKKFIRERFKEKAKKEAREVVEKENNRVAKVEEEEERKLEQNFLKFFDEMLSNDKDLYNLLVEHVTEEMFHTCEACYTYNEDITSGCLNCGSTNFLNERSMMFKLEFETRLKNHAFELFKDGSLMQYISEKSLSSKDSKDIFDYKGAQNLLDM
jgi:hypothetical protein